jgi:hypothetical protein
MFSMFITVLIFTQQCSKHISAAIEEMFFSMEAAPRLCNEVLRLETKNASACETVNWEVCK